jgi:hypothetical protein
MNGVPTDGTSGHCKIGTGNRYEPAERDSTGGLRLRGFPCRTADQPLNCPALIDEIKSVKELLPIEIEHKQPYSR